MTCMRKDSTSSGCLLAGGGVSLRADGAGNHLRVWLAHASVNSGISTLQKFPGKRVLLILLAGWLDKGACKQMQANHKC